MRRTHGFGDAFEPIPGWLHALRVLRSSGPCQSLSGFYAVQSSRSFCRISRGRPGPRFCRSPPLPTRHRPGCCSTMWRVSRTARWRTCSAWRDQLTAGTGPSQIAAPGPMWSCAHLAISMTGGNSRPPRFCAPHMSRIPRIAGRCSTGIGPNDIRDIAPLVVMLNVEIDCKVSALLML